MSEVLRPVASEQEPTCPYGECDGSTWILDEETNEVRPCRCRDQRVRRAAGGGIGTGIGRRFLEVSFDREPIVSLDRAVLRQVRAFTRSIEENLEAGRGLWFDGPVGTGKTSLAILVAKAAKDAGRSYAVFPVPRLLAEIKRTFDRDASDSYMGFFRRLCTVDLLVLDDLGAEKQTEWVLEQLYSIVNERWQDRRSIVVTTNVPDPDPEAPLRLLKQGAVQLHELIDSGRLDRAGRAELAGIVDRLEQITARAAELDGGSDSDPVVRLRRQVGSRTVSRLREICEEPIPVWGEDLRVTARGA
jgi:DNA replication protein DnaC